MGLHFREDIMSNKPYTEDKYKYTITLPEEQVWYDFKENKTVTRTELEKHGRCIDREEGLDCGCLLCGRS